jgi:serpin B
MAESRAVHLVLPRFHAELSIDLMPGLQALGAGIALDCDRADFTGMASVRVGPREPLCIGRALQKVYIDVDEEGTEAAAVTGIGMVTTTSAPPPPIEFVVDRPFLFILRDEITGADLFIGRIARP